jgi:hypothetical protein
MSLVLSLLKSVVPHIPIDLSYEASA